jgi:hypothetical protein
MAKQTESHFIDLCRKERNTFDLKIESNQKKKSEQNNQNLINAKKIFYDKQGSQNIQDEPGIKKNLLLQAGKSQDSRAT